MKRIVAVALVAALVVGAMAAPASADTTAGTDYEAEQMPDLLWATSHLNYPDPSVLQLAGVHTIRFILVISGKTSPECFRYDFDESIDPYGAWRFATTWTGEDEEALRWVMVHFCISAEQAQKFGATLLAFFAGIDAGRRGVPITKPGVPALVPPTDLVYSGTGDSVVSVALPTDFMAATYSYYGPSNFSIIARNADGGFEDLLANEIGSASGTSLAEEPEDFALLEVKASGPWTVSFRTIGHVGQLAPGVALNGTGPTVLLINPPPSAGAHVLTASHTGSSNFALVSRDRDGGYGDLHVNEIGNYSGSSVITGNARILEVVPRPYICGPSVHTLRVELLDVSPTVWRRFVVPSETKLPRFNRMLEAVMGWQGYHLHMFEIGDLRFGEPDEDEDDVIDERRITVEQVLPRAGSQLQWSYDFGDGWEHQVVVESVDEPSPNDRYPVCLAGARACPPEDCGGPGGYEELRIVLADPDHEEHESLREWAGADFDPDRFDVAEVAQRLRKVR